MFLPSKFNLDHVPARNIFFYQYKRMAISCHGLYHFHIIDPLWRDSTGHMWIPLTKDQLYGVLTHFLCFWPKQAGQQPFELPVISDAMTWSHCNEISILIWSLHWTVTLDPLLHATVSFLMKRPSIAQYWHQNSRDTGKTSDLELKKKTPTSPLTVELWGVLWVFWRQLAVVL